MTIPKRTTIEQVHEFHTAFQVPLLHTAKPGLLSVERATLRINLIAEEFMELCDALGFRVSVQNGLTPDTNVSPNGHRIKITPTSELGTDKFLPNLASIADALGDLDYVVAGTADEHGIPHDEIVAEIHRSNMSKLGLDGKPVLREDGKVLKGPGYTPPNLWPILMKERQVQLEVGSCKEGVQRTCIHCAHPVLPGSNFCGFHQ